ncbi:hypothetical protein B9G69_017250 [Bdellovibrio sp. SKB1291214]|uniref:hypothetical protein n=1 Tax=Bdellovibrio sp. SKB1291214 TaxID=1732569 RepID=UPI0020CEA5FB|nr:hypothetical protein [Bdellovibrio sp. SKB1291214]UYL08792.1 hypothetical protein B9G69_017250 [Bdellovibrio sp. SKB1291214]
MKYMGCLFSLLLALPVSAAIPKKTNTAAPKILSGKGELYGGLAGSGFTLLDVRKTAAKGKKLERLVFDVGDQAGGKMKGWPGYFHAELKNKPQRLVLSFAQMPNSLVNEVALNHRLRNSVAIKNTAMNLDPVDNSLNLTMDLKQNTKVRVYQVAGKKTTSKVVVDLLAE